MNSHQVREDRWSVSEPIWLIYNPKLSSRHDIVSAQKRAGGTNDGFRCALLLD